MYFPSGTQEKVRDQCSPTVCGGKMWAKFMPQEINVWPVQSTSGKMEQTPSLIAWQMLSSKAAHPQR